MKHFDKHKDSKNVASLLVLLLAFSCLVIFGIYGESILASGNFNWFIVLVFIAMGLFTGLLFLVNKETKITKIVSKKKK